MNFLVKNLEREEMSEIWTKLETQFVERKEPIPKEFEDFKKCLQYFAIHPSNEMTKDLVKTKYKQLVLLYHPDKGGDKVRFIELTKFYEQLLEYLNFSSVTGDWLMPITKNEFQKNFQKQIER